MLRENLSSYTRYTDVVSPLNTFKEDKLLFAPGANWEYSSFGYRLLACSLQGAAKTTYSELMKTKVFNPSNMKNTEPDDSWAIIPNRVAGYRLRNGELRRADLRDVSENLPAGGYLSTASDLVRFALAFNNELVTVKTKQLMTAPVDVSIDSTSEPSWRDAIPQRDKYGYGLMLLSKYVDGMIGHTGRQAGASTIVVLVPKKELAIAVMTNTKGWNGYLNFVMKVEQLVTHHIRSNTFKKSEKPQKRWPTEALESNWHPKK